MSAANEQSSMNAEDAFASRDCVISDMVEQIESQGYYLTQVDSQPTQGVIDLRWAAQIAGRSLGRHVRTYAGAVGAQEPQKVTLVVAPTDVRTASDVQARDRARVVIEGLLDVHSAPRPGSLSA